MKTIGCKLWAIPEGYLPPDSDDKPRPFVSHEAACLLNAEDADAHVSLMDSRRRDLALLSTLAFPGE